MSLNTLYYPYFHENSYFVNSTIFVYFSWCPLSLNLLWCQECTFYCPLRNKRSPLLPEGTDIHIQQHVYQKGLTLCLPLYYYSMAIVEFLNCKKTEAGNITVYMVLVISPSSTLKFLFVLVLINVSEQSFP